MCHRAIRPTGVVLSLLVITVLTFPRALCAADRIQKSLQDATEYLRDHQNPDGGYGPYSAKAPVPNASDVGITGLVVYALARHPAKYKAVDGPFVSEAVDYLLSKQQPDGAFYDPRDPVLKNYRTSVVIMALAALDPERYAEPIERARKYVLGLQLDESKRYSKDDHLSYGAYGYGGSSLRGDLSNSGFAADALWESGLSASHPTWRRLEVFASRAQNAPKLDPLLERAGVGTTGDGGFRYAPNDTRGPMETIDGKRVFSSYGSMTYQGLKSLLYAGVSREDPRVQEAFEWISRNFTVTENPGMATPANPRAGLQGLFYYYHTMAKCLQVYGEPVIVDGRGVKHDWAKELSEQLMSMQHEEGYWVNEEDRWWEGTESLGTAFAMIALSISREELKKVEKEAEEEGTQEEEETREGAAPGSSASSPAPEGERGSR